MSDAAKIFTDIYRQGFWGKGSGGGSVPQYCREYIAMVERLIRERGYQTVLDIGCGDGIVSAAINWGNAKYYGIDIVPLDFRSRVKLNPHFVMASYDAREERLPEVDLAILKEVTQHIPNADVQKILDRCAGFRAVLHCSTVYGTPNEEIETGQTRGVDLTLPPFNLNCEHLLTYQIAETRYICQLWEPGCNCGDRCD